MFAITFRYNCVLALTCVATLGCNQRSQNPDRDFVKEGDYDTALVELRIAEGKNPRDWKIKRNLGIVYFRTDRVSKAIEKLSEAYKINTSNGRTLLFLGLAYEKQAQYAKAVEIYSHHLSLGTSGKLTEELQARIRENERKKLRQEVRQSLRDFENRKYLPIEPTAIAVLYFRNVSDWDELNPIVKGIQELISHDLRKIQRVQIVNRLKVQFLLEELAMGSNEFFDRIRTPDAGRLLGANYLISGGLERVGQSEIQVNAGVVATKSGRLLGTGTELKGQISQIVDLSKKLVLNLLEDLDIQVMTSERQDILRTHTKSSLAFIAFSKGLDFEDRNLYAQARYQYNKALKEDANFGLAKVRLAELPKSRLSLSEMEKLALLQSDNTVPAAPVGPYAVHGN